LFDSMTDHDNSGGAGEGTLQDSATNSAAGIQDDVGHGRCWIDTDDGKLYYFLGVAGDTNGAWTPASAVVGSEIELDDEILAGSYNLVYNGSFEAALGDGDATASCAACVDNDIAGTGWTVGGTTPDISFTNPSDDLFYGDGYNIQVTASGAANEEIEQTLTALPSGATYKLLYRNEGDGIDQCQVTAVGSVSGGLYDSGNLTNAAWASGSGTFTTTALENVDINLISVNAGDVCRWDHVAVYRIDDVTTDRDEVSQPGIVVCQDTDEGLQTTTGAFTTLAGLDCAVTVPGPGYIIEVEGHINAVENNPGFGCQLLIQLMEDIDGGGYNLIANTRTGATIAAGGDGTGASYLYKNTTPTPGSTYSYQIQVADSTASACDVNDSEGLMTNVVSTMYVTTTPTR
jgi:hypothetical protein